MNISPNIKTSFKFDLLDLEEDEARALCELTQYGDDSFLSFFYENLGRLDLQDYEEGLKKLFKSIDSKLAPLLKNVDDVSEEVDKLRNEASVKN